MIRHPRPLISQGELKKAPMALLIHERVSQTDWGLLCDIDVDKEQY
jgi:fructose-1,6-bisphosphatase/sedoheptulose 1,7-bisphosphatase-like protein